MARRIRSLQVDVTGQQIRDPNPRARRSRNVVPCVSVCEVSSRLLTPYVVAGQPGQTIPPHTAGEAEMRLFWRLWLWCWLAGWLLLLPAGTRGAHHTSFEVAAPGDGRALAVDGTRCYSLVQGGLDGGPDWLANDRQIRGITTEVDCDMATF